ncbi:AbrB/MazE/SpoVT family DNA-binding domain-containing protein [Tardisphaera miroshnichenkoae]
MEVYVDEVKVTRNYQVAIPIKARERAGIKVGDTLMVYTEGQKIVMVKKRGNIASLNFTLGRSFSDEEVDQDISEAAKSFA